MAPPVTKPRLGEELTDASAGAWIAWPDRWSTRFGTDGNRGEAPAGRDLRSEILFLQLDGRVNLRKVPRHLLARCVEPDLSREIAVLEQHQSCRQELRPVLVAPGLDPQVDVPLVFFDECP